MNEIITWHNDPELKKRAVSLMDQHIKTDTLIKGDYFKDNGSFKGCHMGCVINDLGGSREGDHHKEYERVAGLPQWFACLAEFYFENLPEPQNQEFSRDVLDAIPVGADLKPVYHKFMIYLLSDPDHGTLQYCEEAGRKASKKVIELHKRCLRGVNVRRKSWAAAWDAAWDAWDAARAARAAWDAAWAAAWAAGDAWDVRAAKYAAEYAARGAKYAAGDAARGAHSQKLIELLRAA